MTPRSLRNLNPGDLRPRASGEAPWPNQSGIDTDYPDPPYSRFPTAADGWCALGLWTLTAAARGLNTVALMIGTFAPPSDGNATSDYTASVAKKLGVGVNDPIDPTDPKIRESLCRAIARWEGPETWADADIAAGMALCSQVWPAFSDG